jgi:L-glyceraldehyde 3-phosphate reductase
VTTIERRRLGSSDLEVSALALGSWRTYERIPREAGLAVMRKAREVGINFLDDARYNDETGDAPLKTGYSEVVFGELFRAAGWKRDEVILGNKLWWEFWPEQSAAQELDGSLQRMGMDHIDLAYAERPPEGLTVEQIVHDVNDVIKTGKLRAWGVLNWPASLIEEAGLIASNLGVVRPCAAQLAYSLVMRSPVEDDDMIHALESSNVSVVASYTLMGGALSGKYAEPGAEGRITARLDKRDYSNALRAGEQLVGLVGRSGSPPAALAIAFALANPQVASVLFGATKPQQIDENVAAVELNKSMKDEIVDELRQVGR